jgi:hypothetical protein
MSGCAPVAVCGAFAEEPEKKSAIELEPPYPCAGSEAVALGAPMPPLEHPPATSASKSEGATKARPHRFIR